jgi:magnesium-dependent phosphatase 1
MPASTFQPSRSRKAPHHRQETTTSLNTLPKLIVFDLDNTLWTPELYQLRKLQRANMIPKAGKDVKLMKGSAQVLEEYVPQLQQDHGVQFAVASRTKSVEWAHALLGQFGLRDILSHVEIFPGNKRTHFQNLQRASGVAYSDMLFFDDARDGKFGNCETVSEMGVLSVHCPNGIDTVEVFTTALERYKEWDKSSHKIVEWDGSVTDINSTKAAMTTSSSSSSSEKRMTGTVTKVKTDKRYGFIRYRDGESKDVFFHFRNFADGTSVVEEGDEVSFFVEVDSKTGKPMAGNVSLQMPMDKENAVQMRCFSMNMPFAALLANGYKTLESRNGTMFAQYAEGTQLLLHVGRRVYPDGNKHLEVMKSGGLDDAEIEELKSLPSKGGYGKGSAVAIVELGRTYETTLEERSDPDFQRRVAAYGADSGRIVTEIKRAAYLKKPIKHSGQPGVFKVAIDPELLPDGWFVPSNDAPTLIATISG